LALKRRSYGSRLGIKRRTLKGGAELGGTTTPKRRIFWEMEQTGNELKKLEREWGWREGNQVQAVVGGDYEEGALEGIFLRAQERERHGFQETRLKGGAWLNPEKKKNQWKGDSPLRVLKGKKETQGGWDPDENSRKSWEEMKENNPKEAFWEREAAA